MQATELTRRGQLNVVIAPIQRSPRLSACAVSRWPDSRYAGRRHRGAMARDCF